MAIAAMKIKNFNKLDFKKIHPAGNLGTQLKTVEEIMLKKNKIPFVNENLKMRKAIKILSDKKLGILIAQNKKKNTTGIITDGQIRRFNQKNIDLLSLAVKDIMTKNPISIEKLITKFQQLAKDAQSSGDPVLIENYLQHAEHYSRRLAEINHKNQSTSNSSVKNEDINLSLDSSENKKI